jgi:hypothetical protein
LELAVEVVNIPSPDQIGPQRIRLDSFRNPWSRDLSGNALQHPTRAIQRERPRRAKDRFGAFWQGTPVLANPPPCRSPPPAVIKLADFVPPSTSKDHFYHPYSPSPARPQQRSITPPGYPESEEDDFIPLLEDCTVRSEVGDCDHQPDDDPQAEREPEPTIRNWRIRNTKTKAVRYVDSNELFKP